MGQACSEKADIYSLGVILWELITGEHPKLRSLRPFRWALIWSWQVLPGPAPTCVCRHGSHSHRGSRIWALMAIPLTSPQAVVGQGPL